MSDSDGRVTSDLEKGDVDVPGLLAEVEGFYHGFNDRGSVDIGK